MFTLLLICDETNDLYQKLTAGYIVHKRFKTTADVIQDSVSGDGLLVLANGCPRQTARVDDELLLAAQATGLRLFVEFPEVVSSWAGGAIQTTKR